MVWRKDHKAGTNADIRLSNTQSTKAKLKIHGLNSIKKETVFCQGHLPNRQTN